MINSEQYHSVLYIFIEILYLIEIWTENIFQLYSYACLYIRWICFNRCFSYPFIDLNVFLICRHPSLLTEL